jgi:hypothetical protein
MSCDNFCSGILYTCRSYMDVTSCQDIGDRWEEERRKVFVKSKLTYA